MAPPSVARSTSPGGVDVLYPVLAVAGPRDPASPTGWADPRVSTWVQSLARLYPGRVTHVHAGDLDVEASPERKTLVAETLAGATEEALRGDDPGLVIVEVPGLFQHTPGDEDATQEVTHQVEEAMGVASDPGGYPLVVVAGALTDIVTTRQAQTLVTALSPSADLAVFGPAPLARAARPTTPVPAGYVWVSSPAEGARGRQAAAMEWAPRPVA